MFLLAAFLSFCYWKTVICQLLSMEETRPQGKDWWSTKPTLPKPFCSKCPAQWKAVLPPFCVFSRQSFKFPMRRNWHLWTIQWFLSGKELSIHAARVPLYHGSCNQVNSAFHAAISPRQLLTFLLRGTDFSEMSLSNRHRQWGTGGNLWQFREKEELIHHNPNPFATIAVLFVIHICSLLDSYHI